MGIRSVMKHWQAESLDLRSFKKTQAANNSSRGLCMAQTDETIASLTNALAHRRTVEARELLSSLATHLRHERARTDKVFAAASQLPDEMKQGALSLNLLKHWNMLAQCLPTVEDIPKGREQNVLRAIVAILRANNMGDLGAMTQVVEGQEGAVDDEEEDQPY